MKKGKIKSDKEERKEKKSKATQWNQGSLWNPSLLTLQKNIEVEKRHT